MFFAFGRFHKPGDFIGARLRTGTWLKTPGLTAYLALSGGKLENLALQEADLIAIELLMDDAWQETAFGGYSAPEVNAEPYGFCHLRLDENRTAAELVVLAETNPSPSAYQSPVLGEALSDLLRERPDVSQITLDAGAVSEADRQTLAGLDLRQGQNGVWQVVYDEPEPEAVPGVSGQPSEAAPGNEGQAAADNSWLELSVLAESEAVEAITELFGRYGYNQGVVIEEAVLPGPDGGAVVDAQALVTVRTYIPATPEACGGINKLEEGLFYLGKLRHIEPLQVTERREEDWANAWKEFYQVHRVGRRTIIKPPWQAYDRQPDDLVVEIDPGMAFGTGLHPTTRLCLQLMEDRLDPAQHHKVLDLGTGSGILAIAAGRLGVPYILGLDTDEVAIRAARQNVTLNGLDDQIEMEAGSLAVEKGEGGFYSFPEEAQRPPAILASKRPFDAVIANIIARILIALAEPMAQALRPGGLLITSGIIGEKAGEVGAALESAGLELVERREESDWVAFAHRRR